jgi:hypothetical protein
MLNFWQRSPLWKSALLSAMLLSVATSGCVKVPVRVEAQTEGPEGKGKLVDPSTIRPGTTTREQVLHDWGWSDSHVDSERLFVGSMRRSTRKDTGFYVGAAIPVYMGNEREWEIQNLFLEFDEKGVVTKSYFVSDFHLVHELASCAARTSPPALDLSKAIRIKSNINLKSFPPVFHSHYMGNGTLVLAADALEFHPDPEAATTPPVRVAPDQLKRFRDCGKDKCLELRGMSRDYSIAELSLGPADVFTILRYLRQLAPSAISSAE